MTFFATHAPHSRAAKLDDFWNGTYENIPERQQCVRFQKSQLIAAVRYITPPYCVTVHISEKRGRPLHEGK